MPFHEGSKSDGEVRRLHVLPAGHRLLQVHPGRVRLQDATTGDAARQPGQGAQDLLLPQEAGHATALLEAHAQVINEY